MMEKTIVLKSLSPRSQTIKWPRKRARVLVFLRNDTDKPIDIYLSGYDTKQDCLFEFLLSEEMGEITGSVTLTLPPHQTIELPVFINPPAYPLFTWQGRHHHFAITTNILNKSERPQSILGRLKCKPLFGTASITLLALSIVVLFVFFINYLDTYPSINSIAFQTPVPGPSPTATYPPRPTRTSTPTPTITPSALATPDIMTYEAMFKEIAAEYNLDWRLLVVQAYYESGLEPVTVGTQNEKGLMQIMPLTWSAWANEAGVSQSSPFDPYSNVKVSAAFLAYLKDYFRSRGYPDLEWALVAYNWGPENLRQHLAAGKDWADLPSRPRNYALKIKHGSTHSILADPKLQQPIEPIK